MEEKRINENKIKLSPIYKILKKRTYTNPFGIDEISINFLTSQWATPFFDEVIEDYEDKPSHNLNRFNSFSTSFAFNTEIFDSFISFMEETTLNKSLKNDDFKSTPLYNSRAIEVEEFIDLGTWPEVFKFMGRKY